MVRLTLFCAANEDAPAIHDEFVINKNKFDGMLEELDHTQQKHHWI